MVRTEEKKQEWTDREFMGLPGDGYRCELVQEELVVMGRAGAKHSYYAALMNFSLTAYCRARRMGVVFDGETSFKMASGKCRSPDCAFFSRDRLLAMGGIPTGYIEGAPDLVVEILFPGNTVAELHDKVTEYFANGCRLLWLIHPEEQYVLVYHQPQPHQFKRIGDCLEGEDILPGFSLSLGDFFPKPEL